jgi:hypothetical protein
VDRHLAIERAIQRLEAAGRDHDAWEVREAATKSVRSGAAAAKAAETMLDAEPELLNRLRNILSAEELRAVEIGTVRLSAEDVRLWMASGPEEAEQLKHFVFANRWTVKKGLNFIRDEIDQDTTVQELSNRCLAARGRFETTVNTFRITIVRLDPNQGQK